MDKQQITSQEIEPIAPPPDTEQLSEDPEIDVSTQVTLPVGMKIDDRYEILDVLGAGGFATVYRAHHLTIDRDVALKVMDLKKGVDPSYSERFFREAKIAAKIHHNNVVSIYDFGHVSETKQPYIAMEMLSGRDLSHELEEVGPLSPKRMYVLFRPVLDALAEGHRLGIVHKDLKPENLYLVDPGGPRELMKILDFGVARVNSSEVAKLTTAGQLLGTPRYLAPEYIKSQAVSPAIDVYQMALIISEALTGIPAVTGDPFHAMMLHCSGKLQISGFLLEGPVGDVFRKAISIDPAQRYADCGEFAKALDSIEPYFESNVPLQGGAPQIIPEGSITGHISGPYSGSMVTGAMDAMGMAVNSGSYSTTNVKKIAFLGILLFLVIAGVLVVVGLKMKDNKDSATKTEEELLKLKQLAEEANAEVSYTFVFKSNPEASVKRKSGDILLCHKTPCDSVFKSKGGHLSEWITIFKEGYEPMDVELTVDRYNENEGVINVDLKQIVVADNELIFKFVYSPANAKAIVIENGEEQTVCKLSPCTYVFNASQKAATITFSANGYESQNVLLTEEEYNKSSTINIALVKQNKKTTPSTPPQPGGCDKNSCRENGGKIEVCNGKEYKVRTDGQCENGKFQTTQKPDCKEKDCTTDGKQIKHCKNGKWETTTSGSCLNGRYSPMGIL